MEGISVIMPSYLGKYEGSRKDPVEKFIRAVESFQAQTHPHKELVIVSDGCEITNRIYREQFQYDDDIKLMIVEKSNNVWPGVLREAGRSIAKWDWICYLDTDDYIIPKSLEILSKNIETREGETVFLSKKYIFPLVENPNPLYLKFIGLELDAYLKIREKAINHSILGKIGSATAAGFFGTWQILHHKEVSSRWRNSTNMGEDKEFIDRLMATEKWKETKDSYYVICHNTSSRKLIWDI